MKSNEEINFELRGLILKVIVKIISRLRREIAEKSKIAEESKPQEKTVIETRFSPEELAVMGILAVSSWEIEKFNIAQKSDYTIQPSLDEQSVDIRFYRKEIEILTDFIKSDPDKKITQLLQTILNTVKENERLDLNFDLRFINSPLKDKLDEYRQRIDNDFILNAFISKALNPKIEKCETQQELENLLDKVGYISSFYQLKTNEIKVNYFFYFTIKERIADFLEGKTINGRAPELGITRAHGLRAKILQMFPQKVERNPEVGRNPRALFTHNQPKQLTGVSSQEEEKKFDGPR